MSYLDLELLAGMILALPLVLAVSRIAVALGFPVTPLDERLGHVDGLRGFLALAVVYHHFVIRTYIENFHKEWLAPDVYFFNNLGKGGVAIFFMITGAVFYPRIAAGADHVKWVQLYVSRAFRILPLTIIVVTVVALISGYQMGWTGSLAPVANMKALVSWTSGYSELPLFGYANSYRLNAGVMWSLKYEWAFYTAIIPIASTLTALLRGRAPTVLVPIFLFATASTLLLVKPGFDKASFLMLFSLGMLVAEARRLSAVRRMLSGGIAAVLLSTSAIGCMIAVPQPYSMLTVTAYALMLLAVASGNSFFGVLSSRPARALGDASFSIYMLHGLALSCISFYSPRSVDTPLIWLPVAAVIIVVGSSLSYTFLERPMIEMGKRVVGWRPRRDRSLSVELAP